MTNSISEINPHMGKSLPCCTAQQSDVGSTVDGQIVRALVECAAFIGWRHEELRSLRVWQIDLEHRVMRLEPGTTKNDEGREAPMTEKMHRLLAV